MALDLALKLRHEKDPVRRAQEERNAKDATAIAYAGKTWLSTWQIRQNAILINVYRRCRYGSFSELHAFNVRTDSV
jgi:hypothetical protein